MMEILWNSIADSKTYNINNRAIKWWFVAIDNFQLRPIHDYNKFPINTQQFVHSLLKGQANVQQRPIRYIENVRAWQIYNKGWFKAIANAQDHTQLTNNV